MTDHTGRDYVRADEGHAINRLTMPPSLLAQDYTACKREAMSPALPFKSFALDGLLTKQECSGLLEMVEQSGFKSIAWEYDPVRLTLRHPFLKSTFRLTVRAPASS